MFNTTSSTTVCAACGRKNPANARFCVACDARLGAEPSIGAAAAPVPPDGPHDASHAVPSRPAALDASAAADTGAIWVKLCIGGLVVLLGFMGWALYMLTDSKVPQQLPTGQSAAVPEVPAIPSPPASPPASPPPPVATAPAPSPSPPPAARPATAGAAVAPSDVFPYTPPTAAQQRRAARARSRPAPVDAVAPGGEASAGAWVEPSRPPAVTSSPTYRDDGPPIVPGPGPAVGDATVPAGVRGTARPADPGPPVVDGPGPHYDFSTPGARGR
ncbi:zinc ribbon domain-containing protein [Variovorax boronicumulans]|uniref:zinc ribbon domain-containing protein n=1 Tax=Variovorax boronicumulans TaxID=436515 RepID=UPI001C589E22